MTSDKKDTKIDRTPADRNTGLDLGATLREAREREAMTVTSLASELFLPASTIEALENNDYDRLPEPAYIRGYIRNYAKATGLDPHKLGQQFDRLNLEPPKFQPTINPASVRNPILSHRSARPTMWVSSIVLMIAMVWWGLQPGENPDWLVQISDDELPVTEKLLFESEPIETRPAKFQTLGESLPEQSDKIRPAKSLPVNDLQRESVSNAELALEKAGYSTDEASTPKHGLNKPRVLKTAAQTVTKPVLDRGIPAVEYKVEKKSDRILPEITEQPTLSFEEVTGVSPNEYLEQVASVDIIGSNTSRIPEYGRDRLQLRYKNQSWTEIRDAENKVLLHGLIHTGETRTLEGKAPFTVFLGNSPAVDLVINGLPFDQTDFNRSNKTARFSVREPAL